MWLGIELLPFFHNVPSLPSTFDPPPPSSYFGCIWPSLVLNGFAAVNSSQVVFRGQKLELELELIQTQMAQKPMLRAEVGMRVRCANKASAE